MSTAPGQELPPFLDRRAAVSCLRCRAEFAPCGFALARGCGNEACPIVALAAAADSGPIDLPQFLGDSQ
jgi:hypothetical protein